jgi:virginiamycin B lyase
MVKRLMRIAVLPAAAVTALWAGALPASGAQLGVVRTFPTPAIPFPGTIAAGPEGEMWISGGTVVGRMTTGGELTTFETSQASVGDLVAGSDDNVWFGDNDASSTVVGRLTPLGEIAEFNEEATYRARFLALGADGDVWYTAGLPGIKLFSKEGEPSAIGRITPSGQVTEFSLGLESKALLDQIVAGPDGNLWFVNQAEPNFAIGRITPKGEIKEFAISGYPWLKPSGIAAGVDGNVYFGASGENPKTEEESVIGEITPAGETKIVKRLNFSEVFNLATGPEGSLWFTGLHTEPSKPNVIGRLTPAGVLEEDVANLGAETEAYPITPGPDGNMWFVTISKTGRQVDAIGTGAPAASQASPVVAGADQVGSELSCDGATWSTWGGPAALDEPARLRRLHVDARRPRDRRPERAVAARRRRRPRTSNLVRGDSHVSAAQRDGLGREPDGVDRRGAERPAGAGADRVCAQDPPSDRQGHEQGRAARDA